MTDKLIYISNYDTQLTTPYEDYNQWLKGSETQPYKPTNPSSIKFPKVVKSMNKKTIL